MRSDLVFRANAQVPDRYKLCQLANKATRKLHRTNSRLPDTINDVLIRFHEANPEAQVARETSANHPIERHRRPASGHQERIQDFFAQNAVIESVAFHAL